MATIDSLTLKATPLGTDTIELNDGKKGTLASLPISTLAQTALNDKEPLTLYRDANFTAVIGRSYNVNDTDAGVTVTNPESATEGDFFAVFVQGGSVTVGGTAYTDGAKVEMHYVGGGWERSVFYPASGAFGTAAFRDVGQAAGNVLELSAAGTVTVGGGVVNGVYRLYCNDGAAASIEAVDSGVRVVGGFNIKETSSTVGLSAAGITQDRLLTLPDATGTLALLTDITVTNLTGTVPVAKGGTGLTAPGTTGNVLTSDGTAWTSATNAPAIGNVTGLGAGVGTALAINAGGGSPFAPSAAAFATVSQLRGTGRLSQCELFTDFMSPTSGLDNGTDGFVWGPQPSGAGSGVARIANVSGRPGVLRFSTGTATNGRYGVDSWNTETASFLTTDGTLYMEWAVRIPTLSDGTETFTVVALAVQPNATTNQGLYFRYTHSENAGDWTCVANGGSATTADSNVPVVANTWYRLGILVNAAGTSVGYYINAALVGTITTNIPSGLPRLGGGIIKSAGTTPRVMDVDYTYYLKTFTTAR
jgi:hypothetical protein